MSLTQNASFSTYKVYSASYSGPNYVSASAKEHNPGLAAPMPIVVI